MYNTYDRKKYTSNEQAFQCTKAVKHNELELAQTLKELYNSLSIKSEASDIVTTPEWDDSAPDFIMELFDRKMCENPDLLERLIDTAPHQISCVYKPPKGKIENCIKFMKDLVVQYQNMNYEIWILGDLNTDMLRRDDPNTVQLTRSIKQLGLRQLINGITRPNERGGSCIDLILTDCIYIRESSILDDLIADHYSVFCIRKKDREHKTMITKTVRDYSNFDENNFEALLKNKDWENFDRLLDPDIQWEIIYQYVTSILMIMCPFKKVTA